MRILASVNRLMIFFLVLTQARVSDTTELQSCNIKTPIILLSLSKELLLEAVCLAITSALSSGKGL